MKPSLPLTCSFDFSLSLPTLQRQTRKYATKHARRNMQTGQKLRGFDLWREVGSHTRSRSVDMKRGRGGAQQTMVCEDTHFFDQCHLMFDLLVHPHTLTVGWPSARLPPKMHLRTRVRTNNIVSTRPGPLPLLLQTASFVLPSLGRGHTHSWCTSSSASRTQQVHDTLLSCTCARPLVQCRPRDARQFDVIPSISPVWHAFSVWCFLEHSLFGPRTRNASKVCATVPCEAVSFLNLNECSWGTSCVGDGSFRVDGGHKNWQVGNTLTCRRFLA